MPRAVPRPGLYSGILSTAGAHVADKRQRQDKQEFVAVRPFFICVICVICGSLLLVAAESGTKPRKSNHKGSKTPRKQKTVLLIVLCFCPLSVPFVSLCLRGSFFIHRDRPQDPENSTTKSDRKQWTSVCGAKNHPTDSPVTLGHGQETIPDLSH